MINYNPWEELQQQNCGIMLQNKPSLISLGFYELNLLENT
jgi:hypothetical protein